ncbi:MAG: hypothetical protein EP335_12355 [Alphaproteobacteria bacterium]|nr:MAG: hypothetical protein EP335_12355 [Alphaproteobacteria bacterium]
MADDNNPPRQRILLHCGAPKTGTTSIQHYLDDNDALLRAQGVVCPPRFISKGRVDPLHKALVSLRKGRVEEKALSRARLRLKELFEHDDIHTVLVSNESVLGEPFIRGSDKFFPEASRAMGLLAQLFEGFDVTVVYFVRDFSTYVPSYYVQEVRRGLSWSLDRYCASFDGASLTWQPVVKSLRKIFGADHVRVFDHAALVRAPAHTVERAFDGFMDGLPSFDADNYQRNASVGGPVLFVYRLFNMLFSLVVPGDAQRERRKQMRKFLFTPLGQLPFRKRPSLSARHEEDFGAAFRRDKETLGL